MFTRTLDEDPIAGQRTIFHYDEESEKMVLEEVQDVTQLVEVTKFEHRARDERTPWKGDFHKVASIPMTVYADLEQRGIVDDPKAFKRWLNERDNAVFRTRPGRV